MTEHPAAFESAEFERLVRDALANLFDPASLATHALAPILAGRGAPQMTRADGLRRMLLEGIERLKPESESDARAGSQEWRPYLLLHGRYVEGLSLQQLQTNLSLSERQVRREHSRAVQAVAAQLWYQFPPVESEAEAEDEPQSQPVFPVNAAPLDLEALVQGVTSMLDHRADCDGVKIELKPLGGTLRVTSDRVILRQVLLRLLSYVLDVRDCGPVTIELEGAGSRSCVRIRFQVEDPPPSSSPDDERVLAQVRYWCQEIDASLDPLVYPEPRAGALTLSLPSADLPLLLVVDDQETALRMFQRYLAHTGLRLTGVRNGADALPMARRLQPQAITLDLMMPSMDGWEVLQSLKADPVTRHIPVIVCSVWEEPELASSLGATDFLSKPIKQQDLLAALARLRLLASSGAAT